MSMRLFALAALGTLMLAPVKMQAQAAAAQAAAAQAAAAQAAAAQAAAAQAAAAEPLGAIQVQAARLKAAQDKGDWAGALEAARAWKKLQRDLLDSIPLDAPKERFSSVPFDATPLFAEGDALYRLGDIDGTIRVLPALLGALRAGVFGNGTSGNGTPGNGTSGNGAIGTADSLEKPEEIKDELETARDVRRNYPTLRLQPLQFVTGEGKTEQKEWSARAAALLQAKKYDEIEATARGLQKSGSAIVQGQPHLDSFFAGLSDTAGGFAAAQNRIAAWRAARPHSDLAHLAAIDLWLNAAWNARGTGFGSTITPGMERRMDAALEKGALSWNSLPKTAFDSPLAFHIAMQWGQLTGAPSPYLDRLFAAGTSQFPTYQSLYDTRANQILPRWGGAPGQAEAMIRARADKIGGEEGDIFYARIVWGLSSYVGLLNTDFSFDYARAQRGLQSLNARYPDSIDVTSARFGLAYEAEKPHSDYARDFSTVQQIFASPRGYLFENSWVNWSQVENQKQLAAYRMEVLSSKP